MLQAISGTNSGFERPKAGKSIHLRARELLPIATHRVPAVKVQTMTCIPVEAEVLHLSLCLMLLSMPLDHLNVAPTASSPALELTLAQSQVDKSKFVQRRGARLLLGGKPFEFAGASNYYMLTRSVEKATRPQVPRSTTCRSARTFVMYHRPASRHILRSLMEHSTKDTYEHMTLHLGNMRPPAAAAARRSRRCLRQRKRWESR